MTTTETTAATGIVFPAAPDGSRSTTQAGAAMRELEDAVRALPEVVACHYVSGSGP
ncbi:MAG: Lrp/AsnC ligand binding domain-containing protein, partial [Rubrivivax sp.]|nr:Lrp/AsnC ligand binding domain-containing protein [Rubrivivax sp.]